MFQAFKTQSINWFSKC